eukprot:8265068-Prorocentrum_lima.AAC.1
MQAEQARFRRLFFVWRADVRRLREQLVELEEQLRQVQSERDRLLERVAALEAHLFEETGRQHSAARQRLLAEHLLRRVWAIAAPH